MSERPRTARMVRTFSEGGPSTASGTPRPLNMTFVETVDLSKPRRQRAMSAPAGRPVSTIRRSFSTETLSLSSRLKKDAASRSPTLPLGSKFTRRISESRPDIIVKVESGIRARQGGKSLKERVAEQSQIKAVFNDWVEQRAALMREKRKISDEEKQKKNILYGEKAKARQELAQRKYEEWYARLEAKEQSKMNSYSSPDKASGPKRGGITAKELQMVFSKRVGNDLIYGLLDVVLSESVHQPKGAREPLVDADTVDITLTKAELEVLCEETIQQLIMKKERAAKIGAVDERSKEEKAQEDFLDKIGLIVLESLGARTMFGATVHTMRHVFAAAPKLDNGNLDFSEFKGVMDRLDIALTAANISDLWKTMDADKSGDISPTEFERFLTRARAKAHVNGNKIIGSHPKDVAAAMKLIRKLGVSKSRKLFEGAFEEVARDRLSENLASDSGTITKFDYQAGLRQVQYTGLAPALRINMQRCLEKLFPLICTAKASQTVELDAIELFIRQMIVRVNAGTKSVALEKLDKDRHKKAMLNRVGKVLMMNVGGTIFKKAEDLFRAIDVDKSGSITKNELRVGLNRLDCGLSNAQMGELINAMDSDGNGTIEIEEFTSFLKTIGETIRNEEKRLKEKTNPHQNKAIKLMEEIIMLVPAPRSVLEPILYDIRHVFKRHSRRRTVDADM